MENELTKLSASERISVGLLSVFEQVQAKTATAAIALRTRSHALDLGVCACQLYFAAILAGALAYALVTNPGDFAYDFSLVHGFITVALCAVCIWLFQKRAKEARTFAITTAVACAMLSSVDMFLFGAFDVVAARLGAIPTVAVLAVQYCLAAAVIVYLATSITARYVLDRPLDRTPTARTGHSFDVPLRQRVRTWPFWRDLGIYFIVFSFAGHWAEMLFCYNIYLGVFMGDVDFSEVMLWHQWLFPYFAEGVAVVLIVVLLTPVKEWLLKKFGGRILPAVLVSIAVTAAVCTTVDFTCGMICNQNYEVWDYRALPFNFMGQVCLQNSTVYTVAASLILWIFYPLMDRGLRRMPRSFADGLFFALLGIYAFSALLHFMYVGDVGLIVGDFVMKPE
ncbi:MAG: putative ABC transporter permease [Eggerthellaceae bacterium]|nr:putative ABC transporter permease [Eggerthellaceae bacterium]